MSKYEVKPLGRWGRLVQRRWSIIRPPGRIGRVIRLRPVYTGFTVTTLNRWSWLVLWPNWAWYYRCPPVRLKPVDITIDCANQ